MQSKYLPFDQPNGFFNEIPGPVQIQSQTSGEESQAEVHAGSKDNVNEDDSDNPLKRDDSVHTTKVKSHKDFYICTGLVLIFGIICAIVVAVLHFLIFSKLGLGGGKCRMVQGSRFNEPHGEIREEFFTDNPVCP